MRRCARRACRRAAEPVGRAYTAPFFRNWVNHSIAWFSGNSSAWREHCVNRGVGKLCNFLFAAVILVQAAPAYAASTFALPDPSGVTLFTLGVTGLLIGRRFAGKGKD